MALAFLEIVKAIDYICTLSPVDVARASPVVRNAMDHIWGALSAMRDRALAEACRIAIERPEPMFLTAAGEQAEPSLPECGTMARGPGGSRLPAAPCAIETEGKAEGVSNTHGDRHGTLRNRSLDDIVEALSAEGFVQPGCEATDIFPHCAGTGLSFEASAGSTTGHHHAFPGGLALHVASNLRRCLSLARDYRDVYGTEADTDVLVASCVLHDCMKPYVLCWTSDAEPHTEGVIAGEGAHHVSSLAQAILLGVEPAVVIAAASAPRDPGSARHEIASFAAAACVVAGVDVQELAMVKRKGGTLGYDLIARDSLEQWLVHFSDSDHIFTNHAADAVGREIASLATERYGFSREELQGARYRRLRGYILARLSSERLYWQLCQSGRQAIAREVDAVLREASVEARG